MQSFQEQPDYLMSKDQPNTSEGKDSPTQHNKLDAGHLGNNTRKVNPNNDLESERDLLVFKSQICEQAGRFEDMIEAMSELCQNYDDLTHHEKNLLSCAYKNVIGSRRASWRILSDHLFHASETTANKQQASNHDDELQKKYNNNNNNNNNEVSSSNHQSPSQCKKDNKFDNAVVKDVLETIEMELRSHCCNIIEILTNRLIPSADADGESRVFYQKMKGDYFRYLCEISPPEERREKSNESMSAYKAACEKAMIELPPTHPVRLGLMLNFSVFYYDIMKSPERSCRLAKQAFDDAIAELDTLSEESYRDSTIIMQLLRDNLNLWESEQTLTQQQQQQINDATTTSNLL